MMKKVLLSLAIVLLAAGNAFAVPRFMGIDNKNGKTTIKIEIPACDRDSQNGLSIDNVKLYNNGKMLSAKKVRAIWAKTPQSSSSSRNSPNSRIAPSPSRSTAKP